MARLISADATKYRFAALGTIFTLLLTPRSGVLWRPRRVAVPFMAWFLNLKMKRYSAGILCVLTALAGMVALLVLPRPPLPSPAPLPFETLHPHTQAALLRLGVAPERVTQGLGSFPASAGIHGSDGTIEGRPYCAAFDLSVSDLNPTQTRALLHTLRGAGLACWWRVPGVSFPVTTAGGAETGPHLHGIDPFVPHKPRLETQIRDYVAGRNGLEVGRFAHCPDPAAADPPTPAERRLLYRASLVWHLH